MPNTQPVKPIAPMPAAASPSARVMAFQLMMDLIRKLSTKEHSARLRGGVPDVRSGASTQR